MVFCYNKADLNLKHTMIEVEIKTDIKEIYITISFCKRLLNFD